MFTLDEYVAAEEKRMEEEKKEEEPEADEPAAGNKRRREEDAVPPPAKLTEQSVANSPWAVANITRRSSKLMVSMVSASAVSDLVQ